jgi:hypothetical protein
MASKGNKKLNSIASDEHDMVEYRKRVALYVDGSTVSYEDTNFVSGDSPVVLDVFADLGRPGHEGYVLNDGAGNLLLELSTDGTTYGGSHTLRWGEQLLLNNLKVNRIRLTWQEDTSYRALVA